MCVTSFENNNHTLYNIIYCQIIVGINIKINKKFLRVDNLSSQLKKVLSYTTGVNNKTVKIKNL